MIFDWQFAFAVFPSILSCLPVTLALAALSMVFGSGLGFVFALGRVFHWPLIRRWAVVHVSFFRGTPLLVQLFLLYYGLPILVPALNGGGQSPLARFAVAVLGFSLNAAAYLSECFRSALESVEPGQIEACYSVGLRRSQALRRVVLPQAFAVALPSLGNIFIGLVKGSSLAFSIMVVEIIAAAKVQAADGYRYIETYLDASILYWVVCFAISRAVKWAEFRSRPHPAV